MATKQNETKTSTGTVDKSIVSPTYTVDEFANAPASVGAKSPDIVRAALATAGKKSATIEEAKKIVEKFKNKEVK